MIIEIFFVGVGGGGIGDKRHLSLNANVFFYSPGICVHEGHESRLIQN